MVSISEINKLHGHYQTMKKTDEKVVKILQSIQRSSDNPLQSASFLLDNQNILQVLSLDAIKEILKVVRKDAQAQQETLKAELEKHGVDIS